MLYEALGQYDGKHNGLVGRQEHAWRTNNSRYITECERKTNVQHHSQVDDLWACFKVPEWGVFCHTARLRDRPARLKLVLSDSAMDQALVCKNDMTQLTPQNILGWASIV